MTAADMRALTIIAALTTATTAVSTHVATTSGQAFLALTALAALTLTALLAWARRRHLLERRTS